LGTGKHVIFLGAGASCTSGYPLAEGLRRIVSSEKAFKEYLSKKTVKMSIDVSQAIQKRFSDCSNAIRLFREGGFGTLDEFSYLAGKAHPQDVHQIKQLVGLILALHNPEDNCEVSTGKFTSGFETSDYYPFIQRLFREKEDVNPEVAILTYNYDPYFEFLLSRAYYRRAQSAGKVTTLVPTELTSGLGDRDAKTILEGNGFCLLKLHGTAVLPPQPPSPDQSTRDHLTFEDVFWEREKWVGRQNTRIFHTCQSPAMYFPWELIDKNNRFVNKESFLPFENLAQIDPYFQAAGRTLYDICSAIWQRAQREIENAKKISFIGLSMHEFLKPGLSYLFANRNLVTKTKSDNLEIVLACPGSLAHGTKFSGEHHPNSLARKLLSMLGEVCEPIKDKRWLPPDHGKSGTGQIVCYEDFESFIKSEL
jgi:hypothetical protein